MPFLHWMLNKSFSRTLKLSSEGATKIISLQCLVTPKEQIFSLQQLAVKICYKQFLPIIWLHFCSSDCADVSWNWKLVCLCPILQFSHWRHILISCDIILISKAIRKKYISQCHQFSNVHDFVILLHIDLVFVSSTEHVLLYTCDFCTI